MARDHGLGYRCGGGGEGICDIGDGGWRLFAVDFSAYGSEGAVGLLSGFEGEAYAYYFEWVGEEDGDHAGHGAGDKATDGGFFGTSGDYATTDLFVGKEFDTGIGEDAEEGCGMAFE